MKVKDAHSCPILCNPMDYTVHGILQARILEWVAFPFSRGLSNPGTKPGSPALQVDSYCQSHQGSPRALLIHIIWGRSDLMRNESNLKNNSLCTLKMKVKVSQLSDSLRPHRLYSPWNSPGQNTGVGSLSLLQGIFPNQGSNPGLPRYR